MLPKCETDLIRYRLATLPELRAVRMLTPDFFAAACMRTYAIAVEHNHAFHRVA